MGNVDKRRFLSRPRRSVISSSDNSKSNTWKPEENSHWELKSGRSSAEPPQLQNTGGDQTSCDTGPKPGGLSLCCLGIPGKTGMP